MPLWRKAEVYLRRGRWFDLGHTIMVVDFAKRLCWDLGGDEEVVIPASILHDIGYSFYSDVEDLEKKTTAPSIPPYSKKVKLGHLTKGAELAKEILNRVGYNHKSDEIAFIVRHHEDVDDTKRDLGNINHTIVSDADALSRLTDSSINCLVEIYGIGEMEILEKLMELYKNWFITEKAMEIAEEELRKLAPYQKIKGIWKPRKPGKP